MKFVHLLTIYAIILKLVSADMLRKRINSTSPVTTTDIRATNNSTERDVSSVGVDDPMQSECELIRTEDECNPLEQCGWIDGRCRYKLMDGCGRWGEESTCESFEDCVWISDARDTRPDAKGQCSWKENIIKNGNCAAPALGFVIRSESACNSVKGCSWVGGGDSSHCSVAPTQLECDDFRDKNTCKEMGCLSKKKKKKKGRECVGRWEHEFLSTLKRTDGIKAKHSIEEEFGKETFTVLLIKPGDKKIPRENDRSRIKLVLNKEGFIRKTPRFG